MSEEAHVQTCKYCDGTPECYHDKDGYHISCTECGHGIVDQRLAEAVKLWNREYGHWMNYGS